MNTTRQRIALRGWWKLKTGLPLPPDRFLHELEWGVRHGKISTKHNAVAHCVVCGGLLWEGIEQKCTRSIYRRVRVCAGKPVMFEPHRWNVALVLEEHR